MIYVGIDVASEKHDFIIMNSNGKHFTKNSITIPNTEIGFKKLHKSIQDFCGANNDYEVRIGVESTGFYHYNLLFYLLDLDYKIMVINPILTNMSKKSKSVHTGKNDNLDAKAICKFLRDPDTVFVPYTLLSYHTEALKSLSRERFNLIQKIKIEKQNVYKLVTLIFPEFLKLFSNIYQGSATNLLIKYPSPKLMARAHLSTIKEILHGRCKVSAELILETAKSSIGQNEDYLSFQLRQAFKRLNTLIDEMSGYIDLIKGHVLKVNPKILTIPGISYITAGLILGEIGDITRFKNVDKLISFTGLDVVPDESGKYSSKHLKISKKGSRYLRYAFFQVARVAWQYDPILNDYYLKKKSEGKHYCVILGHIEKKLVRIVYSVLKNNKDYYIPQK